SPESTGGVQSADWADAGRAGSPATVAPMAAVSSSADARRAPPRERVPTERTRNPLAGFSCPPSPAAASAEQVEVAEVGVELHGGQRERQDRGDADGLDDVDGAADRRREALVRHH